MKIAKGNDTGLHPLMRFWPLAATIYFCVSGGPQGLEQVMQSGAGMGLLLILVTPLIWALPAALMSAELGSALPDEGGYYVWVRRGLGWPWAFLCGWWSWVYSWVDAAIYPVLFAEYLASTVKLTGGSLSFDDRHPWLKWAVGLVVIVPFTAINIRGIKLVGNASIAFFAVLLSPFVVFVVLGLSRAVSHPELAVHPFVAGADGPAAAFGSGLFVVMWNYLGWDSMSTILGEVREPKRSYPRALMIGVAVVTLGYFLPALVGIVALHDPAKWDTGAWTEAAKNVAGTGLALAVSAVGVISAAGMFSATLLASSRIPFVIAEDRMLPQSLTALHPRWRTPWVAILVSSVFYTLFSFSSFKNLAAIDVIVYSAGVLLEFAALVILRIREPELERPFRIPGGWPLLALVVLLPVAILTFAVVSQIHQEKDALGLSAIALATGPIILVGVWARRKLAKP